MAGLEPRRGAPTPPIAFGSDPAARPPRLAPAAEVPDAVLTRLGSACASVTTDPAVLADAARDWWPLALAWAVSGRAPARPAAVARPTSADEVAAVLRICDEARVPVTAAAGRSGVCGASVPVFGGVVLDLCGLSGIVGVDNESLLLDVRAGSFGDVLEDELRAKHGVTIGHWPQSINLSTVGGWLACRGAGQYSTRYGKIEDMVVGLEVATAGGTVIRTGGHAPRSATGPDLTQVFVGSEGTLGIITEARLRVHPVPHAEARAAYLPASFAAGLDVCRRVLRRGGTPAVLRLYDQTEAKRNFDVEGALLIVLDEGDPGIVEATMAIVDEEAASDRLDAALVQRWLDHRNDVSALPALVQRGIVLDTIEIAARWSALPRIYAEGRSALDAVDGMLASSAHQSHAYADGACLYFTWAARMPDGAEIGGADAERVYRAAWDAVTEVTLRNGGTLSHHHGIGLNRSRFMAEALGPAMAVLQGIKDTLDPHGILNPGKLGLRSPWGDVGWP